MFDNFQHLFGPIYTIGVLICFFFLFRSIIRTGRKNKNLESQQNELRLQLKRSLEETLDLATSEQLLKELRGRQGVPYILLLPIKEKDFNGITIESHCINQVSCFAMLHLAKAIAAQNFRNSGVEPPKLPPLNNYFS